LATNRLVEFSHGQVEVLAVPSQRHQFLVVLLYECLLPGFAVNVTAPFAEAEQ
jgi:hypothetical protein